MSTRAAYSNLLTNIQGGWLTCVYDNLSYRGIYANGAALCLTGRNTHVYACGTAISVPQQEYNMKTRAQIEPTSLFLLFFYLFFIFLSFICVYIYLYIFVRVSWARIRDSCIASILVVVVEKRARPSERENKLYINS